MNNKHKIFMIVVAVGLTAVSRLIDHPYNFTPIIAIAIFSGCYLKQRWGLILPLCAMLISDYLIGFYAWQVMASVYASIILAYFIGRLLAKSVKWYKVISASLFSSVIFFFVTNFSVWAFSNWYPHTWPGLMGCFYLALPFFRNSIAGDLIYTGMIFGAYNLALIWLNKTATKTSENKYGKIPVQ